MDFGRRVELVVFALAPSLAQSHTALLHISAHLTEGIEHPMMLGSVALRFVLWSSRCLVMSRWICVSVQETRDPP